MTTVSNEQATVLQGVVQTNRKVTRHRTEKVLKGIGELKELVDSGRARGKTFCIDTETTGLNVRQNKMVAFMFGDANSAYILDVRPFHALDDIAKKEWKQVINLFIEQLGCIVGHNLKFDWIFIYHTFGVKLHDVVDTMLQEQVLRGGGSGMVPGYAHKDFAYAEDDDDEDIENSLHMKFNLGVVARRYNEDKFKEDVEWFYKPAPLDERPEEWIAPFPEDQVRYMGNDIHVPAAIYKKQRALLQGISQGMYDTAKLENLALSAFALMEYTGMAYDEDLWKKFIAEKTVTCAEEGIALQAILNPYMHSAYEKKTAYYNQWKIDVAEVERQAIEEYKRGFESGAIANKVNSLAKFKNQRVEEWKQVNNKPKISKSDLEAVEGDINLGSPQKLLAALREYGDSLPNSGLKDIKSTAAKTLKYYTSDPLILRLKTWKEANKFLKSFGENFIVKGQDDGRFHSTYRQIVVTGRTACSDPNLQQIPGHIELKEFLENGETVNFRRCFVAPPGSKFLTCDLPNIEVRILANMSEDHKMLASFEADRDLHNDTAFMMFPNDLNEGDNPKLLKFPGTNVSLRDIGKKLNFGLAYGLSAPGLADQLMISLAQAEHFIGLHKKTYDEAHTHLEAQAWQAIKHGFTVTIGGRMRYYPEFIETRKRLNYFGCPMPSTDRNMSKEESREVWINQWREFKKSDMPGSMIARQWGRLIGSAGRQGKNAGIQGTSADIIKLAMVYLYHELPEGCVQVAMIHDELVVECLDEKVEEAKAIFEDCMYRACKHYLKVVKIPPVSSSNAKVVMQAVASQYWCK